MVQRQDDGSIVVQNCLPFRIEIMPGERTIGAKKPGNAGGAWERLSWVTGLQVWDHANAYHVGVSAHCGRG
jgi:hypothetical protein